MYSSGGTTTATALSLDSNTFKNNSVRLHRHNPAVLVRAVGWRADRSKMLSQAVSVGGAVALNSISTLNMSGNTFSSNMAGQGGALFVAGTSTSELGIQSSR